MPRVLCVDDNLDKAKEIGEILSAWDSPYGKFTVDVETNFGNAVEKLKNMHFDMVTLDLHGSKDPDPLEDDGEQEEQEGKKVLDQLRKIRFVPVIFYTGYAHKIQMLETGVVKVVQKGGNDLENVRSATQSIYGTGLPELLQHIEEEKRTFIWDTVDKMWADMGAEGEPEDLAYLLARRLAARFNRESIKELLKHKIGAAKPIEMYIYPPLEEVINTGCIIKMAGDDYWLVATPACDFAQNKADKVLLIGAKPLESDFRYIKWTETGSWKGKESGTAPKSQESKDAYENLKMLLKLKAGDRYRILPKTFFLKDLVVDFQEMKQVSSEEALKAHIICRIDSPYREEILLRFSRYYGRLGVPDIEMGLVERVFS